MKVGAHGQVRDLSVQDWVSVAAALGLDDTKALA